MISIKRVSGKGFLSFKKEFSIDISDYEGTTLLIDGENRDDDYAGSNGSGKSALLESINWGLYGKLCRSNRYAEEVINNDSEECQVEIVFDRHPSTYRVLRSRGRKSSIRLMVFQDEKPIWEDSVVSVRQKELEKLVGFNFPAFSCSVMFGHDFANFPNLTPSERSSLLSDVLSSQRWITYSSEASSQAQKEEIKIRDLREDELELSGRKTQLDSEDFITNILKFEEDRKEQISVKEGKILSLKKDLQNLKKESTQKKKLLGEKKKEEEEKLRVLTTTFKDQLKDIEEEIKLQKTKTPSEKEKYRKIIEDLNNRVMKVLLDIRTHDTHLRKAEEEIRRWKSSGGSCVSCTQPIPKDLVDRKIKELMDYKQDLLGKVSRMKAIADAHTEEIQELKKKAEELEKVTSVLRDLEGKKRDLSFSFENKRDRTHSQIRLIERDISSIDSDSKSSLLEGSISSTEKEITDLKEQVNPFIEKERNRKAQLLITEDRLEEIQEKISSRREILNALIYWKESFKKIQVLLFEESISSLESILQDILSQYSSEISVGLSLDRETKSGSVKTEINIVISDREGSRSYEMYSGGERQKIRLSLALALSQLIQNIGDQSFNFIAFDEPNSNLDHVGKDINFRFFEDLATQGKAVLVTDHDAYFKDMMVSNITVVKKDGNSVIISPKSDSKSF